MKKSYAKAIRRRMQSMVSVERPYFNDIRGVTLLTSVVFGLIIFTLALAVFYEIAQNGVEGFMLRSIVWNIVTLLGYLVCTVVYRFLVRNVLGYDYGLVTGYTSLSFAVSVITGYQFFRCVWSNEFSERLAFDAMHTTILNNLLRQAFETAGIIAAAYLLLSVIGSRGGEGWGDKLYMLWVVVPAACLPMSMIVMLMPQDETQLNTAAYLCLGYFVVVLWLAVRFAVKTALYFILKTDFSESVSVEDISESGGVRGKSDLVHRIEETAESASKRFRAASEKLSEDIKVLGERAKEAAEKRKQEAKAAAEEAKRLKEEVKTASVGEEEHINEIAAGDADFVKEPAEIEENLDDGAAEPEEPEAEKPEEPETAPKLTPAAYLKLEFDKAKKQGEDRKKSAEKLKKGKKEKEKEEKPDKLLYKRIDG